MKKTLLSTIVLTGLGMTTLGSVTQAVTYPSATDGISEVNSTITIGDGGGPEVPPIGPGFPELPEIELPTNPKAGEFGLRYISDIEFGDIEVSTNAQSVFATEDTNKAFPMIVVQDYRGDDIRDGWQVTIKQETELFRGAEIKMSPSVTADNMPVIAVPTSGITLNSSAQIFANTKVEAGKPAGIYSIGMGNATKGVELVVPANSSVGEYSTKLTWNLVSGPVNGLEPEPEP
ncbi:WxL domain-containing protein [Carnobacterium maltaromaticum]|uniref:WxL domain-containing protein n=1 Tax=Carnobacterium maltaromaticum TaxID=2751 RepID=UPI00191BC09B|nr:WxL domain-containing protein [Carnobacterium maltaromaticum]CAD5900128.1 conserved exported hypothetical protein [Carnobacterium maltaromaticum]